MSKHSTQIHQLEMSAEMELYEVTFKVLSIETYCLCVINCSDVHILVNARIHESFQLLCTLF